MDEILNLIQSVSEGFPSYSFKAIGKEVLEKFLKGFAIYGRGGHVGHVTWII